MNKYRLCNVTIMGKEYEVSHEFTSDDVEKILKSPKVGVSVSFQKAYEMRFMENHSGKSLINTVLIRENLSEYVAKRGMYIDFSDGELTTIYMM